MSLDPGTHVGSYEILALIGAGHAGEVYKAKDSQKDAVVALRILSPGLSADLEKKQRFEREARLIASLSDLHFAAIHEIGREGETDFVVTEYVEGSSLAAQLKDGALPLDEALNVAISIADALNTAHRNGVTHRDLKPSNVMLSTSGVKLLDFGLADPKTEKVGAARQAQNPSVTPESVEYKAPEQLDGAECDARTDIFAFGVLLYEMVTGTKAFQGKNVPLLVTAIATLDPDPLSKAQPDCPPALDHIAKRCLAKSPDDRWQTAHDLLVQLKWIAESGGASLAAARSR
jgi:serine/threonine protein kinase